MEQKNRFDDTSFQTKGVPEWNGGGFGMDVDDLSITEQIRERYSQDTRFRKHLARWVMFIVPIWLSLVLIILACSGLGWMQFHKNVIIALLATTTANVLGLAYIVLKGIFPEKSDKPNKK